MTYFDSAYIAKCYLAEPGQPEVVELAERAGQLFSLSLARIEFTSILHRKVRERALTRTEALVIHKQFQSDMEAGVWRFIPLTESLLSRAEIGCLKIPPEIFLRSADCLHLCAASEAGFSEVYSNDRHLLSAAAHFGLRGINVIP